MKVPTSIKVDGDLWHKFKLHCVEHKINMSDVLEKLIKKYLGAKK
ncbi:type II toxin-antitoxin system CcdA family antitoxin [archaeon]|nr:type II toxin-antitoxin system CcdA family antitoxin [archaeon]